MAFLYKKKRSPYWYAWTRDRFNKRVFISTKMTDKRLAQKVAQAWEVDIVTGANVKKASTRCSLEWAIVQMQDAAITAKRSASTLEFMTQKGRQLIKYFGGEAKCAEIRIGHTTAYMEKRLSDGVSLATVRKEIGILIQAMRRAIKMGELECPLDPRSLMPDECCAGTYVPRTRWLQPHELDMLCEELSPDHADFVRCICFTGCRLSEIFALRAENYDPKAHTLFIAGTKTKKSKRLLPLIAQAEEIIARRAKERPKGPLFDPWDGVWSALDNACRRVERKLNPGWVPKEGNRLVARDKRSRGEVRFDTVSPNDLRRSFASYLCNGGADLFTASRLMGHSSTTMIQHTYAQLSAKTLAVGMAKASEYLASTRP